MTASLVCLWQVEQCDHCRTKNASAEIFPAGWCILVTLRKGDLVHRAFCPACLKGGKLKP